MALTESVNVQVFLNYHHGNSMFSLSKQPRLYPPIDPIVPKYEGSHCRSCFLFIAKNLFMVWPGDLYTTIVFHYAGIISGVYYRTSCSRWSRMALLPSLALL
ncbi:hypothetical protein NPIL_596011 [Nephila pilipes]|uniref:Transmembrane protein n=1 Tax=Nephila pilipes TaxID=299642 RepID=A0A8X6QVE2_NEPPI|nr:hypothetical protein NPIL_596011 [Nephila pilipes]